MGNAPSVPTTRGAGTDVAPRGYAFGVMFQR
ncbi:hypothetical protein SAMN06296010_0923 [Agreia pratensis]|uniref:Uncharacterized protein n=1 Tax=Agreia pratensis TaxID=150121 RepID=A0A1X7IVE3_9MICO|nr:hypothetical protein SAMN06296010_0923 [Agreia pratensis]